MNGEKNQKAKHVYGTVWPFSLSLDKANQYVFVNRCLGLQAQILNKELHL